MEPQEIEPHLLSGSLRQFISFTGLDVTNTAHHATIFNNFTGKAGDRTASTSINYKMLTANNELFKRRDTIVSRMSPFDHTGGPALQTSSVPQGMIKRKWPLKYLEDRPALIVTFIDLDWNHPAWADKRTECESKINSLRQSIGNRDIRLALVLIQRQKTSLDDPFANERALELCQHCRITSRNLFVLPLLPDEKLTSECISKLERAFHDITQEFYHSCFKRIRARNVPNNDTHLIIRQQFKLAFISELREDRHSALRYYKQTYQICSELDANDIDAYEIYTVASLLNYKICELNFVMNSAVEAINQFRKHHSNYFGRTPGFYPSRELAAIEMAWWKSQQCRIFAELFNRAVTNGLAAYPSQNPGRFLNEAATHFKQANEMVRALRARLAEAGQQQRTPLTGDPLQSFDLNSPTVYYGQRPWRAAQKQSADQRTAASRLPPVSSASQQLLEHAAKLFLEGNVRENYVYSLQLFSSTISQFKRYGCQRFATLCYLDMSVEYMASKQFPKALQVLRHVFGELQKAAFHPFICETLVRIANSAFCAFSLNDWVWALVQLLRPEYGANSADGNSPTFAEEMNEEIWTADFRKFLAGEIRLPFPIPNTLGDLMTKEEIAEIRNQWHHLFLQSPGESQFQLDMTRLEGGPSSLLCGIRFLSASMSGSDTLPEEREEMPVVYSGDLAPVEVSLRNFSRIPLCFEGSSVLLEEVSPLVGGKISRTLEECVPIDGKKGPIELAPNDGKSTTLFFVYTPNLTSTHLEMGQLLRSQSPHSSEAQRELIVTIRRFTIRSTAGTFYWDIEPGVEFRHNRATRIVGFGGCLVIKVRPQRRRIALRGSPEMEKGISLHVDESINLPFSLQNTVGANLRNVKIVCHKVYRDEEPQNGIVQRTFAQPPRKTSHSSMAIQQEHQDGRTTTTLVPAFNQEVATLLGPGESTDFSIRLQSKSTNCMAFIVQIYCSILNGADSKLEESIEWVEKFPIRCIEPFKAQSSVFCENGEEAQCLVVGQRFRVETNLVHDQSISINNVHWKLGNGFEQVQPSSASFDALSAQMENATISPKEKCCCDEDVVSTHSFWLSVLKPQDEERPPSGSEENRQIGEAVVEWSSTNSCEAVRSIVPLPPLTFLTVPVTLEVELADLVDRQLHVGSTFEMRYTLKNTHNATLGIHLSFERADGFLFAGLKEDHVLLFPDERHTLVHALVPLSLGRLPFPRPAIRCVPNTPGKQELPNSGAEQLERLNRLISSYTFNSVPTHLNVMP